MRLSYTAGLSRTMSRESTSWFIKTTFPSVESGFRRRPIQSIFTSFATFVIIDVVFPFNELFAIALSTNARQQIVVNRSELEHAQRIIVTHRTSDLPAQLADVEVREVFLEEVEVVQRGSFEYEDGVVAALTNDTVLVPRKGAIAIVAYVTSRGKQFVLVWTEDVAALFEHGLVQNVLFRVGVEATL